MVPRFAFQYIGVMLGVVVIALLYWFAAGANFLPALAIGAGLVTVGAVFGRGRVVEWPAVFLLMFTSVVLAALVVLQLLA